MAHSGGAPSHSRSVWLFQHGEVDAIFKWSAIGRREKVIQQMSYKFYISFGGFA